MAFSHDRTWRNAKVDTRYVYESAAPTLEYARLSTLLNGKFPFFGGVVHFGACVRTFDAKHQDAIFFASSPLLTEKESIYHANSPLTVSGFFSSPE